MTDLSDFGGGVEKEDYNRDHYEDDEDDTHESSNPTYRTGRCRAIKTDGTRCAGSIAGRNISDDDPDLCHMHDSQATVRTIDDDPVTVIEGTSRTMFDNLDDLEVDADRIRQAVHRIHGLEDMPITVTDEGVVLPYRYARATKIVVRTPTRTVQMTARGDEQAVESLLSHAADRNDWDAASQEGEGWSVKIRNEKCFASDHNSAEYSIGLKIFGYEQEWYPVEFRDKIEHEDDTAGSESERQ